MYAVAVILGITPKAGPIEGLRSRGWKIPSRSGYGQGAGSLPEAHAAVLTMPG